MRSPGSGAFSDDIAIDLGTANTLVHVVGRGVIIDEPSVVVAAGRGAEREVLAVGLKAKLMHGRTPEPLELIRPMRDGVIADFVAAEVMLSHFIARAKSMFGFRRPRILICVPANATPVERRAVYETALSAGARRVYLIEEPVAASLGAGLPIDEPSAFMVADIGGGTTDIAVLARGRRGAGALGAGCRQRHGRGHRSLCPPPAPARDQRGQRGTHQDRSRDRRWCDPAARNVEIHIRGQGSARRTSEDGRAGRWRYRRGNCRGR